MNTNKKILILGGSGLVGSHFVHYFQNLKVKFLAPNHKQLDVLDFDVLSRYIIEKKPNILVNFVACTNLDEAEKEKDNKKGLSWRTNVQLVEKLVEICGKLDIFFIHISTDAVFPGSEDMRGPYSEDQFPFDAKGLSWYGETKRQGEVAIKKSSIRAAIVRINYPFGNAESRKDFAKKTYAYIISGYPLFADQLFNPTYLPDLNIALRELVQTEAVGVFHVASEEITTPVNFGILIAQLKKLKANINKGSVVDFISIPGNPPRLIFGGLKTFQTEQKLGLIFHSIETALEEFSIKIP